MAETSDYDVDKKKISFNTVQAKCKLEWWRALHLLAETLNLPEAKLQASLLTSYEKSTKKMKINSTPESKPSETNHGACDQLVTQNRKQLSPYDNITDFSVVPTDSWSRNNSKRQSKAIKQHDLHPIVKHKCFL